MEQNVVRLLRAEEIECRIGTIGEKGVSLLLYIETRTAIGLMNEAYGSLNWQRRHEMVGGNLYCIVSVWDNGKKQWISRMDVGTESYTEKEKGQASDSFKRAAVNFQVAKELYSAPFIWIGAGKVRLEQKNGKLVTNDKFKVTDISYSENREIIGLTICNQEGRVVYSLNANHSMQKPGSGMEPTNIADRMKDISAEPVMDGVLETDKVKMLNNELARTGVALDAVLERYGVGSIQEMDSTIYKKAMSSLKRTKTKVA